MKYSIFGFSESFENTLQKFLFRLAPLLLGWRQGCNLTPNVIKLRTDIIIVGAAFQPRFNDYGVRVTCFRGWKATPTRSWG
jgi:hypothetical protein